MGTEGHDWPHVNDTLNLCDTCDKFFMGPGPSVTCWGCLTEGERGWWESWVKHNGIEGAY